MNRYNSIFLTLLSAIVFYACEPAFRRTESGLQYKIIHAGSTGPVAATGSTVKLHYVQKLHDTVTNSTYGNMPYYKALIPGTIFAYDPFEVLAQGVREGDSVVVVLRMDSLLKKGKLEKLPPHLKPGDELITSFRILKIFPFNMMQPGVMDSLVNADKMQEQIKNDSLQTILGPRRVEAWLLEHHINAPRNQYGTYLEVVQPGAGEQVDSGKQVSLQYKMSTLKGKVMDTNMDTSFRHTDPLRFEVGSQYMLKPVDETIRLLKKGAHARIYIPTMLAMPPAGAGRSAAYDDLVFEVVVLDVGE